MSSTQSIKTAPGVQLQIPNDLSSTPQQVTDPTGAGAPLFLSTSSVGVNQPNPQAALDVNGQINASALNVNPQGAGSIVIGNPSTGSGGFTSLILGISAESGGNAAIQSISQSGTSWGALLLNPNSGVVSVNQPNPNSQFALDVNGSINATALHIAGQLAVPGIQPESSAPPSASLQAVYVDPSTGILYYHD